MSWRTVDVIRETMSNLLMERWRAVVLVVLAAVLTAIVVFAELDARRAAVDTDAAMRAAGRYVFVAQSVEPDVPLDASRCVAMGTRDDVVGAGGFYDVGSVRITKAPGEFLTLRQMKGDMPTILTGQPMPASASIAVTEPFAHRAGVADGMVVELSGGRGSGEVAVLDMNARVPDPGAWVLMSSAPVGYVTECWVEALPAAADTISDVMTAWLTQESVTVRTHPLLTEDRFQIDPLTMFDTRTTKFLWAAGGLVLGLVATTFTWFRRAELALYRTVGAARAQVVLIYAAQYAAVTTVGVLIGALGGLYSFGLNESITAEHAVAAARQTGMVGLTAIVCLTIGVLLVASGRIVNQIRDRL